MANDPIRAKNWSDLHRLLFENTWQDDIKRHRAQNAYRGVTTASFKLSTSLIRLGGALHPDHGPKLEMPVLRSFKKYAYTDSIKDYSEWFWLSLAQHHGMPTRLLDWTNSPLVALHFATYDFEAGDKDAAVWCVDVHAAHQLMPASFRAVLKKHGAFIFTPEMLDEVAPNLETFLADAEDYAQFGGNFMVFFEPPALDGRITNQFAFFSVMPDATTYVDDWLEMPGHESLYRKIIIPQQLKWEVRNKLDQMNITERVLFPGLDGLSRWLSRYYSHYPDDAVNTEDMDLD